MNILDRNYNKEPIEKSDNNQDNILKPNISRTKNSVRDSSVSGIRSSLSSIFILEINKIWQSRINGYFSRN